VPTRDLIRLSGSILIALVGVTWTALRSRPPTDSGPDSGPDWRPWLPALGAAVVTYETIRILASALLRYGLK
jgi:hypothetical protein